ncbi:MAG: methionine biosynthesis protein MetW [Lentisphaerae bacterium GWF2_52_8]|nr:MAG: methionine biosynthesis protein MetW [Lentisphaerae bacterium GWF2_52_8]
MIARLRQELSRRPDLLLIADIIPSSVKMLDLGCGNGALLKLLRAEKSVQGIGVALEQSKILECAANGVPVIHGDLNEGLRDFSDISFDYIVLSQTIQAVKRPDHLLSEMVRVGSQVVISFINIGYWEARFQLAFGGRMPVTKTLPDQWFNTENIHLATIRDFRELCARREIRILRELPVAPASNFLAKLHPNLFASTCVFVITRD